MADLPQVGLEAIIAGMSQFTSSANAILSAYDQIEKKAGHVERSSKGLGSAMSGLTSSFTSVGQSVLKFGAIAGGAAVVGVGALAAGFISLGATAFSEYSKFERMSMSIQNLTAKEIAQGTVVEQQRQVLAGLTAKETEELNNLQSGLDNEANKRDVLTASIQEQKEKIRQLTDQYGDQGLVVIKERAELQGMEMDLADLNSQMADHQNRIKELSGQEGKMVTIMEKVRTGQMSMSDAMEKAGPRAQELLKWIQLLAIQSPFSAEGVAQAFKTALSYGFTTKEAQRLTEAMIDFTAATGQSEDVARGISLALGQMRARGKLSAEELNQLSERGVGVNKILEDMGFTLNDVTKGMVDVDDFIEAVIADMEIFGGSAKTQSSSFAGLTASLGDLKAIGLREFFTGTFKAIQPYTAAFTGFLTKAALETGTIKKLGDALGQYVAKALKNIGKFIATIRAGGLALFSQYLGAEGIPLWYELKELIGNISESLSGLGSIITTNLGGPFSDFTTNIIPMITQGITFINEHFEEFKGALMGIGGVLAAGVFVAIVGGILSLLTPINLIIAGAALLGAAWTGNWYGIRDVVGEVITYITDLITTFQTGGLFGSRSGSFGSVGLLAALGIPPDIIQIIQNVFNQINALIASFLTGGIFGQLINTPGGMAQTGGLLRALGFSNETIGILQGIFDSISQAIGNFFTSTSEQMTTSNLVLVINSIGAAFLFAATTTIQAIDTIIPIIANLINWLSVNIPLAITIFTDVWNGALAPIVTMTSYVQDVVFPLWLSLANLWQAIVGKEIQALAGLWQKVLWPPFKKIGDYLGESLIPFFTAISKILREDVTPPTEKLGGEVFPMLSEALQTVVKWIKDATGFFQGLADAVNNFSLPPVLTPGSPTPFEKALMGIAAASGLATSEFEGLANALATANFDELFGIDRAIVTPMRNATAAFDDVEKKLDTFLSKSKSSFALRHIKKAIRANLGNIAKATGEEQTNLVTAAIQHAVSNWQAAGIGNLNAKNIADVFITSFKKNTAEAQEMFQQMLINAGKITIDIGHKLTGVIGGAVDFLNARIERLQELVSAGGGEFEGKIYDSIQAQELLNAALEDQAAIQDDILKSKEQESKLNFLQQQLDLFETIKAAGLDVSTVLGGLNLGLDASIPDLIAATSAVIDAMINQVNEDLGIASPSKVLFKKMREAGAGMVGGLTSIIPNVQGAMKQTVNSIINVPAGQVGGNNYTTTNNYNFGMNVNTGASPQAVLRQYQVMKAMVS